MTLVLVASLIDFLNEVNIRTNEDIDLQNDINTRLTQVTADLRYALISSLTTHLEDISNPHIVTAIQTGADPVGTAVTGDEAHLAAADPHAQYYNLVRGDARYALLSMLSSYVTTAVAATTYGQLAAMNGPHYVAGAWFHVAQHSAFSTAVANIGWLYLIPMLAVRSAILDRVRFEVTVAGSVDVVVQLGLYSYDMTTGRPGNLLTTLGSVSNPAIGIHEITINQTMSPSWYYMGLLTTGTTGPTVRTAATPPLSLLGLSSLGPSSPAGFLLQAGLTALPSLPIVGTGVLNTAPQIDIRVGSLINA